MLNKSARLTSPNDFARTTKSGLRVTSTNFVGYIYLTHDTSAHPARFGLVIGKKVGNSVARHRLARKIRHSIPVEKFPAGAHVVIRALGSKDIPTHTINVASEISSLSQKLIDRAKKFTEVRV